VSAAKFEGGMSDALDKEIVIYEFERGPISQMLRYNIARHSHHTWHDTTNDTPLR
jgi:hypothetical protein